MPIHDLADAVALEGDAVILLTAPFFPAADPLRERASCRLPADGTLDDRGLLVREERPLNALLKGSLTYANPEVLSLTQFAGAEDLAAELTSALGANGVPRPRVAVAGVLFPDGYGSVSVRITVEAGWDSDRRAALLAAFGPSGREETAAAVRETLLPPLTELTRRCGDPQDSLELPYFNQTYVGQTSHPEPGRAALRDELRALIYPKSAAPTVSDSPWFDEFFYAGYAYNLLAAPRPATTCEKLELLLLQLDVSYARLARSAAAADLAIRQQTHDADVNWLVGLELRLRADYQALVTPTFSFDFHVLTLRDALLTAWDTDALRGRTDTLLTMSRQAVERRLAERQTRRVTLVNRWITLLTALSAIATAEAAVNLWSRFG